MLSRVSWALAQISCSLVRFTNFCKLCPKSMYRETIFQRWNPVSDFVQFGSSRGSVCQTWCLTWFWVLTCAFIVALFVRNTVLHKLCKLVNFVWRPSCFLVLYQTAMISVGSRNIYLLTCWLPLWRFVMSRPGRVTGSKGTGFGHGSNVRSRFHPCRILLHCYVVV